MHIAAGVVLFNPNIDRLEQCLDSISDQVGKIYLIDNASVNHTEIICLIEKYSNLDLVTNKENVGIAKALNQIMRKAADEKYQWVFTLDDDSVCDSGIIDRLVDFTEIEDIAIVCAATVDDKMEKLYQTERIFEYVKDCITAGSLTNVHVWNEIGGFDDKMFIDFVDIEYCIRLRAYGYKIGKVNQVFVHQQYGNITSFFEIFGKRFYRFNYKPVRVYYSVRNQIYCMKKHRKTICMSEAFFYLLGYIGKRIVFEGKRGESFCAILKGIRDGVRM